MNREKKVCQNCKGNFVIEPEDFLFYERIKVPPPTFCPECRLQRRMASRNERTLYFRPCDLCRKNTISRYAPDSPYVVYCPSCWYSDQWDPLAYGRDYDFSKPFFSQFHELSLQVPRISILAVNAVNSEYGSQLKDVKDCYMAISCVKSEDISYSYRVDKSRNCFDVSYVRESELCNELVYGLKCTGVSNSVLTEDSLDSSLLYNCRNCSNCLLSVNLRNRSHQIRNRTYTKEAYEEEKKNLDLGSYQNLLRAREELKGIALRYPRKYAQMGRSVNAVGDHLANVKNCYWCFDSDNMENCKYVLVGIQGVRDCYDVSFLGLGAELCYEGWSLIGSRILFSSFSQPSHDIWYSDSCLNSGYQFGSASCRNKEYCILNKQYTKDEFFALKARITEHMSAMPYVDSRGLTHKYGEFFPTELSPYGYNESPAQEYFPLTQPEATAMKYQWRDINKKIPQATLSSADIPDHIKDAQDSLVDEVISCPHERECTHGCSYAFKITPRELQFYRQLQLPLPRMCPNCRHFERVKERNPLNLWHRNCQCSGAQSENGIYKNTAQHFHENAHCPNEFETSYAPDRPEIVYCEACYNSEVI